MAKFKSCILLVMLSLSVTLSRATGISIIQNEHVPILVIAGTPHSGIDKTGSINAQINGHSLSVAFTENLGTVSIEIKDEGGATLDITGMGTPSGYAFYIPLAGRYTVFFKLSNGDEYYGDFEVTD